LFDGQNTMQNFRFLSYNKQRSRTVFITRGLKKMKRYGFLWEKLISFGNIWSAFLKAARGKGNKPYFLEFILDLENNLLDIQESLASRSYKPAGYETFFIYEPKKRMISSAPFRDRVVHHCLVNIIQPIFEPTFIHCSYANQVGKGTHRAIRYVQALMRINRYIFHGDIRKYFPTIDHELLKAEIARKIKDPCILWLVEQIIDGSNPQEPIVDYFPGDDLFTPIERRKGLPIGNLTSQFFANIYLNRFDHFMVRVQ
jgi:retron-type reverse transcriptase